MKDRRVHEVLRKLMSAPSSAARVIVFLEGYVRSNPEDHEAVLWYADSLRIVGRCKQAVATLVPLFAQVTAPGNQLAVAARIAMALEHTDPVQAEEWFGRAVEVETDVPGWVWALRGANLARMERLDAALESYHMALHGTDVDPDEVLYNMARAYRAKGDYQSALEYLRRSKRVGASAEIDNDIADLEDISKARELARSLNIDSLDTPLH